MVYAVIASLMSGLLSRQWSAFLIFLGGILAIYGGVLVFVVRPALDNPDMDKATASGVAAGMFVVHALIIVSAGLVPFMLRRQFGRADE
jgi:purine-cytosine permease-like protein